MSQKIVVYGGSFNPPHNFHFVTAQQVLNQLEDVEKIIFIPVNTKYAKSHLAENQYRYEMLELVIQKNSNFLLSNMDMKEEHSLSTMETLDRVQQQYPDKEICFLMGSDNLQEIHLWERAEELLEKYKIIVMERAEDDVERIIQENEILKNNQNHIIRLEATFKSNCSATFLRNQIKEHKSIRYLVPDEIEKYIQEHHLYEEG